MTKPIKLLSPWVGHLPHWLDKFESQMNRFETIDWELIVPPYREASFKIEEQLAWISKQVSNVSGVPCVKTLPIGWCDYRPAFGEAFADIYKGYEYCGYCDPDLLFGDLDSLLPPLLDKCDVLSFKEKYLSGCFTILRNIPEVTSLYRKGNYKAVFANPTYCFWDESGYHPPFQNGFYHTVLESGLRIVRAHDLYATDSPQGKRVLDFKDGRLFGNQDGSDNYVELAMFHFMCSKIWPLNNDGTSRWS